MSTDKPAILVCEENSGRRESLVRLLGRTGAGVVGVPSLAEGLRRLSEGDGIGVLVSGLGSLTRGDRVSWARLRQGLPGLTVIGLARVSNPETGLALLDRGVIDHLLSPDDPLGLFAAARHALERQRLAAENEFFRKSLRRHRAELARNARKAADLESIYDATVETLMTALDLRDVETFGHSQTVAKYTQVLARLIGVEERSTLDNMRKGALLHDIGKIAIPDSILKKRGPLSGEEWEKVRLHPELGYGLIREIKLVEEVRNIVLCHHEHFDGGGYPRALKGERIPFEARIFALADALDAITAPRPYRKPRDFAFARREIRTCSGTHFDPQIVEAFSSLGPEKWERIRFETTSAMPSIGEYSKIAGKIRD
jgi:putative nucleotidyltransferase with HDIG domain